jgi:hypothetical protein
MEITQQRYTREALEAYIKPPGLLKKPNRVPKLFAQLEPLLTQHSEYLRGPRLTALSIRQMIRPAELALENLRIVRQIKVKDEASEQQKLSQLEDHLRLLQARSREHREEYFPVIDHLLTALGKRKGELESTEGSFRIGGNHDRVEQLVCQALRGVSPKDDIANLIGALKVTVSCAGPLLADAMLEKVESSGWPQVLSEMEPIDRDRLLKIHNLARIVIAGTDKTQMSAHTVAIAFGPSLWPQRDDPLQATADAAKFTPLLTAFFVAMELPSSPSASSDSDEASGTPSGDETPAKAPPPSAAQDEPVSPSLPTEAHPIPERTWGARGVVIAGGIAATVAMLALLVRFKKLDLHALVKRTRLP